MQTDRPIWNLKTLCPCCEQGFPRFCICPTCRYVTVVCEEMEDTFINPKNLNLGFAEYCPNCKQTKTNKFLAADSESILKAGFTKDEYE